MFIKSVSKGLGGRVGPRNGKGSGIKAVMSVTALNVWGLYLYSTVGFPILFIIVFTAGLLALITSGVIVGF
jgi:hypothetical protein